LRKKDEKVKRERRNEVKVAAEVGMEGASLKNSVNNSIPQPGSELNKRGLFWQCLLNLVYCFFYFSCDDTVIGQCSRERLTEFTGSLKRGRKEMRSEMP
jgi:hypothetical protein